MSRVAEFAAKYAVLWMAIHILLMMAAVIGGALALLGLWIAVSGLEGWLFFGWCVAALLVAIANFVMVKRQFSDPIGRRLVLFAVLSLATILSLLAYMNF